MDPETLETLRRLSLLAAVLCSGLVAGVLLAFAVSVMPALAAAGDATLVDVMQRANVAILTPWFLGPFLGGLAAGAAAVATHLPASGRRALPWVAAGLALYALTVAVTAAVNVPLNDRLAAAGPAPADPAAVRLAFEGRWVAWNAVRTVTCALALGCFAWAALG